MLVGCALRVSPAVGSVGEPRGRWVPLFRRIGWRRRAFQTGIWKMAVAGTRLPEIPHRKACLLARCLLLLPLLPVAAPVSVTLPLPLGRLFVASHPPPPFWISLCLSVPGKKTITRNLPGFHRGELSLHPGRTTGHIAFLLMERDKVCSPAGVFLSKQDSFVQLCPWWRGGFAHSSIPPPKGQRESSCSGTGLGPAGAQELQVGRGGAQ